MPDKPAIKSKIKMKNKKIAIIGCGNLGQSILNGLLSKNIPPQNITVTRRNLKNLEHLQSSGVQITDDNIKAIQESEIIIIALKPYNILEELKKFSPHFKENHILISLATGINIEQIQGSVNKSIPIFRAMPNTAADVGDSITCICSNNYLPEQIAIVKECFDSLGESIVIEEKLMNAATVLGACGIAFVLRFIRGMIQGGIQIGFDAKTANAIVTHTVKGAAQLLIERNTHPEYEIDKVTTPMGCTIEGLNEMEHNGFSSALIKGIIASYDKID